MSCATMATAAMQPTENLSEELSPTSLQRAFDYLSGEMRKLSDRVEILESPSREELENERIKVREMSQRLAEAQTQLSMFIEKNKRDQEELEELRLTVRELRKEVEERKQTIRRLENEIGALSKDLKITQEKLEDTSRESRRNKEKLTVMEDKLDFLFTKMQEQESPRVSDQSYRGVLQGTTSPVQCTEPSENRTSANRSVQVREKQREEERMHLSEHYSSRQREKLVPNQVRAIEISQQPPIRGRRRAPQSSFLIDPAGRPHSRYLPGRVRTPMEDTDGPPGATS